MLTLSCPSPLAPCKAVNFAEIDGEVLKDSNKFRIANVGLFPVALWRKTISGAFRVGEFNFGWLNPPGPWSSESASFIEMLKRAGAIPEEECGKKSRSARFWFDVSPHGTRAYYCLYLKNYGDQIVLFPELYGAIGDEVIANVQVLDSALYLILTECGLAT